MYYEYTDFTEQISKKEVLLMWAPVCDWFGNQDDGDDGN